MSLAPTLSVIMPAFNEEVLLADAIRRLHRTLGELHLAAEIIVVDDGSRDRTAAIADQLARELPGVVAVHQENQGIGGAFRTGAARATGEYLMLWPADMPADPAGLAPYTAKFGRADVIVGCRRQRVGYNPLMRFNAWLYPQLVAVLFGLRVRDVNWIHAYRREAFRQVRLTQRGIPMLAEALVRLRDLGATFAEVEVVMTTRLGGVPSASRLRVMWHTLSGLFSLWSTWRREEAVMSTARPWSPGFLLLLGVLIALGHAVLALTAAGSKSMTSDEIVHLTAGHAYNTRGDFRLQPENGNLPQRWAALPLALMGAPLPPAAAPAWARADVWNYGHQFFYRGALSADEALFAGRAMIALFSAATGVLIFLWSRALFGWHGAFFSLVLFAFCPAFLAHGALATSDVVMTFFFLAAVGGWWRHLHEPGPAWAALSATGFGLACLAKFSAILLAPMFALCAAVWFAGRIAGEGWRRPALRLLRSTVLHAATAWAFIWVFYGFRFSAYAPALQASAGFYRGDWNQMLSGLGWTQTVLGALRDWQVLPEAFLYGFAFVVRFARERAAFLNGDYSTTGWFAFFPFAFLVKTTLPFLFVCGAGATTVLLHFIRAVRQGSAGALVRRLRPLTPLAALFAVYWVSSLASHLNIGHRHILPTYPVLFIAAGWLGRWWILHRSLATLGLGGLALWHAGESIAIRPHYLAYFNQLVGGPAHGWRHLVDSSLDWGQDLSGFKRWLDANVRGEKVFLSYFGSGDPAYEGIPATALPMLPVVGAPRPWYRLTPGVYALSATMLQHVYSEFHGAWRPENEWEFQRLRHLEPSLLAYQNDPAQRTALLQEAPEQNWLTAWQRYELMRFARLCHYLRVRQPDATIGHSIMVYRLDAHEVAGATAGTLGEWRALIEQAALPR